MTPAEASQVITRLCAAYNHTLTDPVAETWLDELEALDYPTASETAGRISRQQRKFPTVADFHANYRAEHRPSPFAPPERWDAKLSPEEVRRRIDAMKNLLPTTSRLGRLTPSPVVGTPNELDELADTDAEEAAP